MASATKNHAVSELRQWHEQVTGASREAPGYSLLLGGWESHKNCWLCAVERELPASRAWMVSSLDRMADLEIPEGE